MRFLNLKLSSPDISDIRIEFRGGLNVVTIPDRELFSIFKEIPAAGLYGTVETGTGESLKNISCSINTSTVNPAGDFYFSNTMNFETPDTVLSEQHGADGNTAAEKPHEICNYTDFITSSYFNHEHVQKNTDHVFDREKIKSLFVNNEIYRLNSPYLKCRENLLANEEKKLTDLNREKQLLELKKMKKEKLLKEIHLSDSDLQRLEKRRESILSYKTTLNEIIVKIESRNKLSSKINNLKKDLIELREIKEKISSVENILKEKFSHFSEKGNDQMPDLEQIQESFNSFRDINEQIEMFSLKKKRLSDWALRTIISMIIFSLTALMFLIFTSSASFVLGITSGIAAGAAVLAGIIYYFKIRKLRPAELFDQKKQMEGNLIDLLKKNNVSFDDYKTGELYEILFQYFEDFINYRDISFELTGLKKKISNSASLIEKEKKLEQFTGEIKTIDTFIDETMAGLDLSIHSRPEADGITRTIHDIDELLAENETVINEKKSLIVKFGEEIEEYDKTENSILSADLGLEEIMKQIGDCRERIEHIKFLNSIFENASESWCTQKMEELSRITLEKFFQLTENSFIKEDITETINNILLTSGRIKAEHRGLKKYISFSIKAALSEMLFDGNLPPVFIIDPFTPDNEFAENMKKLLPDLFPERQVVVILPGSEPDLKGNLITL